MRILFCFLFLWIAIVSRAGIARWDGEGGDGLWNTASNWAGDTIPTFTDDVILDNSLLAGSYQVVLPGGAVTIVIQSLIISPAAGDSIVLVIPASNTADPGLRVTGTGEAIVLNTGAILRNSSRASSGPGLAVSATFRINNGGKYIHHTSRSNASIVSQLSTAAGTQQGIFEYDVPVASYTVSLSNRNYGTLVLSASQHGAPVSYIGGGASVLNIHGDLQINDNVSFGINMSAECIVHGDFIQATSSTFDIQTSNATNVIKIKGNVVSTGTITESGNGAPVIEFNGSNNQSCSLAGSLLHSISLRVNNAAGVKLASPLTLPFKLELQNGKIITDQVNILVMADNSTYTGGSAISFVEGPMKKIGEEDFYFPLGAGQVYAPLGLTAGNGGSATDEFTAEYRRGNPQTVFGASYEAGTPPIDHISYVEFWNLSSNTAAVTKLVTLQANCESFCRDFNTLFIAGYNSTQAQWRNMGQVSSSPTPASCPGYLAGTITAGPVSGLSSYTLGTSEDNTVNPLPVDIVSFRVKAESGKAMITWKVADCCTPELVFEVEKAGPDRKFASIGSVKAEESNFFYSFSDAVTPGIVYSYRLKMNDIYAKSSYSPIVSVQDVPKELSLFALSPSAGSSKTNLSLVSARAQPIEVRIVDMQGRVIKKQVSRVPAGSSTIEIVVNELAAGVYLIFGVSQKGTTNTIRFIKT